MNHLAQPAGSPRRVSREQQHPHCIVCGLGNPLGMGLAFTPSADGRGVESAFDCSARFEGYVGLVHGGVVGMLLDGAMANCLFHLGTVAHTGHLAIRFRHPVLVGRPAVVRAWLLRSRGRLHVLGADVRQDDRVTAVATAKFLESE